MMYVSTKSSFKFLFPENCLFELAVFGWNIEKQMVLLLTGAFRKKRAMALPKQYHSSKNVKI